MSEEPSRSTIVWLGVCGIVVFLVGLSARRTEDEGARQVGQVIGGLIVPFLIAALIWTIIWALAGRRKGRPWLSAWIGGIAVAVAVMSAIGQNAQDAEDSLGLLLG